MTRPPCPCGGVTVVGAPLDAPVRCACAACQRATGHAGGISHAPFASPALDGATALTHDGWTRWHCARCGAPVAVSEADSAVVWVGDRGDAASAGTTTPAWHPAPPLRINLDDFEREALQRLPANARDYYRSGAHDELTLADNRAAWQRIPLHYRVLVDVTERTTATTVLGRTLASPVMVAPTAFHRMAHPDGELATARAAAAAGTGMILSTLSTTALEDVAAASGDAPLWFQLYVYRDRAATRDLVARAEAAGCEALVLTVDAPLLGTRERDVRNGFHLPPGLQLMNLHGRRMAAADPADLPAVAAASGLASYVASLLEPGLSWDLVDWLASISSLPVLIKGVVRPDDAARAVDHGCAGIVVSNHGGRQMDTAPATADVLPGIRDAVGDALTVLVDGGIRRGTDVLKALALGADCVLVGRPVLWGLACAGESGVVDVLRILREELDLAMALAGAPTIAELDRALVEG